MVTDLSEAYATCARFARDHYENFPVASRLLPRAMRPHVAAVYAFARVADDFADEGNRPQVERLALLDAWHECLHACNGEAASSLSSAPPPQAAWDGSGGTGLQSGAAGLPPDTPHIFVAIGATIRTCRLPVSLFDDLLSAFRQDVTTTRYETWDDVLDYCRRSANPVGRLVLGIAGYRDDRLDQGSDAVCTALQLTNFWQDLERDWQNGRLYLPLEDCRREGADVADLTARRTTPAWRQVLRDAGARTAALFDEGRSVCDGVGGRLRLELRLTWLGGRRILSRLERAGFDVFRRRPALGAADVPALVWRAMTWRAR
jgi:hydroxysqualene synthase